MRRFAVGLWKEARDHRVVVLALLAAVPLLVLGAAWALGDRVPPHAFAGTSLVAVPVALALFLIAVGSELFAGERRRGTLDLVRRLPGGLAAALGAKLGAYLLGAVLFPAWGWCTAFVACAAFGPESASAELATLTFVAPDPVITGLLLAGLALGVWVLLVSTWIPQGGAAVLGAGLLLGLLVLPAVLTLKDSPWLVSQLKPRQLDDVTSALAVLAGVGLLALALSWLRGNRRLASAWSPAWRGLACVGVLAGAGYAWGAVALDRALTVDPHDPGFRIGSGTIGVGQRWAFLNVQRTGSAWFEENGRRHFGTPMQPWLVNLETGEHRRMGDYDETWMPMRESKHALQPIAWRWTAPDAIHWHDGATTEERKTLPYAVRTPEVHAWEREALAVLAWHRDPEGRALWFEGDRLVREGDPLPRDVGYRQIGGWEQPIPGGWLRHTWRQGQPHPTYVTIEAATGKERDVTELRKRNTCEVLGPTRLLVPLSVAPGGKDKPRPFRLVDVDRPEASRDVLAPEGADVFRTVLDDGRLLFLAGPSPEKRTLVRWSPASGAVEPLLDADGARVEGYLVGALARLPGGLHVLRLQPTRYAPGEHTPPLHYLFDERTGRVQRLASLGYHFEPLAIVDARTVIAIEGSNLLVRYGPAPGERTVLFPRPE
jgi:hypothetical protein